MTRRRLVAGALGALALLPVAACSGTSKPAAATRAPLTGPTVSAAGAHFTLPHGWVSIPLSNGSEAALQQALHDAGTTNEIMGEISRGQLQGLQAFALDPSDAKHPAKLDFVVAGATGQTLDTLASELQLSFSRLGATNTHLDKMTMPSGQVLRVRYDLAGGTRTAQYYLLHGGRVYELTFTAPTAAVPQGVYDAVAASLSVG